MSTCRVCSKISKQSFFDFKKIICEKCIKKFKEIYQFKEDHSRGIWEPDFSSFMNDEEDIISLLLKIYSIVQYPMFSIDNVGQRQKHIIYPRFDKQGKFTIEEIMSAGKEISFFKVSYKQLLNMLSHGKTRIRYTKQKEWGRLFSDRDFTNQIEVCHNDINKPGVYFLKNGEYAKIGMSEKSVKRRSESQKTIPGVDLYCWFNCKDPTTTEKRLHERFSHLRLNKRGEWFRLEKDLLSFMNLINKKQGEKYAVV